MTRNNHEAGESMKISTSPRSIPEPVDSINLKQYFDEKLYPQLSAALAACARERPDDPVSFVGDFLLQSAERT